MHENAVTRIKIYIGMYTILFWLSHRISTIQVKQLKMYGKYPFIFYTLYLMANTLCILIGTLYVYLPDKKTPQLVYTIFQK